MLICKGYLYRIMYHCPLDTASVNAAGALMPWKRETSVGEQLATNRPLQGFIPT